MLKTRWQILQFVDAIIQCRTGQLILKPANTIIHHFMQWIICYAGTKTSAREMQQHFLPHIMYKKPRATYQMKHQRYMQQLRSGHVWPYKQFMWYVSFSSAFSTLLPNHSENPISRGTGTSHIHQRQLTLSAQFGLCSILSYVGGTTAKCRVLGDVASCVPSVPLGSFRALPLVVDVSLGTLAT